jgi:hypothetical protein
MTKLRLLAELRKLLARPETRVIERKLRICGRSTWTLTDPPSEITIYLDPRRDGRVPLVIHELLHVYMGLHLSISDRMVYELEEAAILAWEKKLYKWLHDPKRAEALESWNKAIERKTR